MSKGVIWASEYSLGPQIWSPGWAPLDPLLMFWINFWYRLHFMLSKSGGPQASVLCGFHIPFQLVYEGVWLPSPPFWTSMNSTVSAEACHWLLPCRANQCQAFKSQGQGCSWIFRTSSKFYSFNMIFLPILLQRDIINPVNYDFKRICDKNK